MDELEAVEEWRATLTEKQRFRVGVAGCDHQAPPGVQSLLAANAMRQPSAYVKLERTNDDLAGELDAAKAQIAELEVAQLDQGSLFGLDLKNDKTDNIVDAIIGTVDLRRAEEIAKATLLVISIKKRAAKARGKHHRPGRTSEMGVWLVAHLVRDEGVAGLMNPLIFK